MPLDLTIQQFARITLGRTETPLHLADIVTANKQKVMPLRAAIQSLSTTQTFLFVTMACRLDLADMFGAGSAFPSGVSHFRASVAANDAYSWTQWAQMWLFGSEAFADVPPCVSLAAALEPAGASIFYLSPQVSLPAYNAGARGGSQGPGTMPPWTVIGIHGTFASLANLGGQMLPFWPNGWTPEDWDTISALGSTSNCILLAPAQLVPAMWLAAQGRVDNLQYGNMMLLSGG